MGRVWDILSGAVQDIFNRNAEYDDQYEDHYDDGDYEDEEMAYEPEEPAAAKPAKPTKTTGRRTREPDIGSRVPEDRDFGRYAYQPMPAIAYPKNFNDAIAIFEALNEGKVTLVDVSGIVKGETKFDEAQRISDYLGGVTHALGLVTTRVNGTMYMITPHGCDILDDYKSGKSKMFDFFKTGTR